MNRSDTITKLASALVKAQADMGNAKKDAVNPFFKKNYADLNAIREAVLPSLNAQGISVVQPTCVQDGKNYVETVLLHESGEWISSLTEIVVDKVNDAQRHGSGLSYARRYALQSITNIGAEDDDAQAEVGKPVQQAAPPTKVFKPNKEQQKDFQQLLDGSNLDLTGKAAAGKRFLALQTEAEFVSIINRLHELQAVPV